MQRKQFSENLDQANIELIGKFLSDEFVDNNLIHVLRFYVRKNSKNLEYLASQFAEILSIGITSSFERETKAWLAIEAVIASSEFENNERTFFITTWRSFSILISDFKHFNRHCEAVQKAYFRFEKYFATQRDRIHTDSWYTDITDYSWWLKVDEFYKSRYKE